MAFENRTFRRANYKRNQKLDIISNNASFADALSDVEPHQHLGGYKSIPQGILRNENIQSGSKPMACLES